MKEILVFLSSVICALVLCSCATKVTEDLGDAYAEMDIKFHNRAFMEKQTLKVPDGVNESRLEKLPFQVAFRQDNRSEGGERTSDTLSPKEFKALKTEFEAFLVATKRFPVAQIIEGLADNELRMKARAGTANVEELDASEMVKADYIINVAARLGQSVTQSGSQKKTTTTMTLICQPVIAKNNQPLDWFPPFTISTQKNIFQKATATGRVIGGHRLYTAEQRERLHIELFRMALVKFIDHIYKTFPAGGRIVQIADDTASVKANRATGLQPNMEMVIYAREKDNPDALRIPLYNATIMTMAQEGNSELEIWRKSTKPNAKKIIQKTNEDWNDATKEYDFFVASDGLPSNPDFIKTAGDDK